MSLSATTPSAQHSAIVGPTNVCRAMILFPHAIAMVDHHLLKLNARRSIDFVALCLSVSKCRCNEEHAQYYTCIDVVWSVCLWWSINCCELSARRSIVLFCILSVCLKMQIAMKKKPNTCIDVVYGRSVCLSVCLYVCLCVCLSLEPPV